MLRSEGFGTIKLTLYVLFVGSHVLNSSKFDINLHELSLVRLSWLSIASYHSKIRFMVIGGKTMKMAPRSWLDVIQ